MKFSTRTNWKPADSRYTAAVAQAAATPKSYIDLTVANPVACGIAMPAEGVLHPLQRAANLAYNPHPFGSLSAREAVAAYYAQRGTTVDPQSILLTASTSEAYSYLLRLLCDVGDEVLIASPGYPLLDVLADLNDVRLTHYPLFYDHGWHIDRAALVEAVTAHTRAIVVIHPNNPTGHYTREAERTFLADICARHELALIVDEVFLDYSSDEPAGSFAGGEHSSMTVVLSGLSKVAALPQMKLAWMVAAGPRNGEALKRLEIIADSYLSVSTPMQNALPAWLRASAEVQAAIGARVHLNLAALDELIATQSLVARLKVEAGWYAILRLPDLTQNEEPAVCLLESHRVLTQPGHLFGLAGDGWLVISLLTETTQFRQAIVEILRFCSMACEP